jgi:tetratricopeptide (TPR) repeat protein
MAPDHQDILGIYGKIFYELGIYFQDESYFRQAEQKLLHAIALEDRIAYFGFYLSKVYYALAELHEDRRFSELAIDRAQRAAMLSKKLPIYWSHLAICYLQLAEFVEERHFVESAIKHLEYTLTLVSKEEERELYLETLYYYGFALDFLGDFTLEAGSYQKAIQILSHVIEKEPAYYMARYTLASCMLHLGEVTGDPYILQDALVHFHLLFAEDPEDVNQILDFALVYLNLADLSDEMLHEELRSHFLEEAETKLSLALSLGEKSAYYYLACLYAMRKEVKKALYFIEQAEQRGILPSIDELLSDSWLEALHQTEGFSECISRIRARQISE